MKTKSNIRIEESLGLALLLAVVGGFLDAYTFIGRGGIFANAQTGNIVLLGIYASKGEWQQVIRVILPISAFIIGVLASEMIKHLDTRGKIRGWAEGVLILEILVLFAVGFVPQTVPNIIVTVTIAFIASVQVSSFRKLVDSPYSSTMCTGNLRYASRAMFLFVTERNPEEGRKSGRYFLVIGMFLAGAVAGGILTDLFPVRSVWAAVLILVVCLILLALQRQGRTGEKSENG
jgi:uncharacterized membrane protein YoaK (UPF0700 family)